jgi:hypothetical protein
MQWKRVDDVDQLPKKYEPRCVFIDANTGLGPFLGYFQPSPKNEQGFYTGQVKEMHRMVCTHYIVLPSLRGLTDFPKCPKCGSSERYHIEGILCCEDCPFSETYSDVIEE